MKQKACADYGMDSFLKPHEDVDDVTEDQLLNQIKQWFSYHCPRRLTRLHF